MQYRHYGKILDRMIKIAASMEDGDKKIICWNFFSTRWKKSYTQWNKEVDDEKIFQDLYEMSGGKIKIDPAMYTISEVKVNTNRDKLKNIKFQRRK